MTFGRNEACPCRVRPGRRTRKWPIQKDGHLDRFSRGACGRTTAAPLRLSTMLADLVFTTDRRPECQTIGTHGVRSANRPGGWSTWTLPNYDDDTRATQSPIYLGSADGLTPRRMGSLPTSSGTGRQIADYNGDGINDLLLICNRSKAPDRVEPPATTARHRSRLGRPRRVQPGAAVAIPSKGAHYDSGVDLGNIHDRRFEHLYVQAPSSSAPPPPAASTGRRRTHGSCVRPQVPTASDAPDARWSVLACPAGAEGYFERREGRLKICPGIPGFNIGRSCSRRTDPSHLFSARCKLRSGRYWLAAADRRLRRGIEAFSRAVPYSGKSLSALLIRGYCLPRVMKRRTW